MMYKISKYNTIKSYGQNLLYLVNTRTTAILDISKHPLLKLGQSLINQNLFSNINIDKQVLNFLLNNGFIIPNEFDEDEWIKKIHLDAREGKNALALGIVLTLACNFRCTYCYETHDNIFISDQLCDSIIKFTSSNLKGKKHFRIAWFGGEPLLCLNKIESLTYKLIDICKRNKINYSARISTNGYLLTHDVALLLKQCHVSEVQVTLDGPPEIHDKRRFLTNGKKTFQTIYNNVVSVAELFDRLIIRINIDNQNAELIPSLLKNYLIPIRNKILISFSVAVSPVCIDNIEPWSISPSKFWKIEKNLGFLADKLGFKVMRGYPIPCTSFCMAYQNNSFLIDPYHNVNRCPKFLKIKEQSYGKLLPNGYLSINHNSIQSSWDQWSPFIDNDCKSCEVLPLCMGGCLLYLQSKRNKDSTHRCFAKHNIVDSIIRENDFIELVGSTQKF